MTFAPAHMIGEANKHFEAEDALENVLIIDLCLTEYAIPTGTVVQIPYGAEDHGENVDLA